MAAQKNGGRFSALEKLTWRLRPRSPAAPSALPSPAPPSDHRCRKVAPSVRALCSDETVRKHISLFEFSLCLSQACLGVKIICKYKIAQKDAFSYLMVFLALEEREAERIIDPDHVLVLQVVLWPCTKHLFLRTSPMFVPSLPWQNDRFQ